MYGPSRNPDVDLGPSNSSWGAPLDCYCDNPHLYMLGFGIWALSGGKIEGKVDIMERGGSVRRNSYIVQPSLGNHFGY